VTWPTHTPHVQACPNLADPYHTLGLLHEAMGSGRKALDFYMIAAHLTPKVCNTDSS
jgi:general transcription factor 3C polypeptide 3 (transcription factor C subunit 4)